MSAPHRSSSPPRGGLFSPRVSSASAATAGAYSSPAASRTLTRQTLGLQVPMSPASMGQGLLTSKMRATQPATSILGSPTAASNLTVRSPAVRSMQSQLQADIQSLNADRAKMAAQRGGASRPPSLPGAGRYGRPPAHTAAGATTLTAQLQAAAAGAASAQAAGAAMAHAEVTPGDAVRSTMQRAA